MDGRPNIYQYLDYRRFLTDLFLYKKETKETSVGFSHRTFSRLAGFKSSNFLKLVLDGARNLSVEGMQKFAKAFGLNKSETNFFEALVLFNQAGPSEEKNRYYERIAQSKSYNQVKQIESNQYAYFSNWYYVALRELVKLKDFREDPQWINRKLKTSLSPEEIKKTISVLLNLKLLARNENKRLIQTDEKIVTAPEIASLIALNYHKEMIRRAGDSLEKSKTAHRDVSALTVSVSKKQFDKIQERLHQFRREIHALASEEKNPDTVYQLNLQFFNLSEVPWNS